MSTTEHRYAMADLPAGRVRVRVFWAGRLFVAARGVAQPGRVGRMCWCLPPRASTEPLVWLPLPEWDADDEPEWWQPEDPATWTWPNGRVPAPLPAAPPGRFVHRTPRGRWAAMAEQAERSAAVQAELAAEALMTVDVQKDRLVYVMHGSISTGHPAAAAGEGFAGGEAEPSRSRRLGSRWWLEYPQLVTYSRPGAEVTQQEVEGRLCRAILTDGLRPGQRPQAWQGTAGGLAALVHEALTSADALAARSFEPTRADLTDQDGGEPMRWFAALSPPELRPRRAEAWGLNGLQLVILHHAVGRSWRRIAETIGGSHEGARRGYAGAIEAAARAANGRPVFAHVTVADQWAALRHRNQAAKRRAGE